MIARSSLSLLLAGALLSACGTPAPPAPTVALAEAARPGVTLQRGSETIHLAGERRVEDGAEMRTPAGGRASLRLDGGSWVLLGESSRLVIGASKIELRSGRLWIDARDAEAVTVAVPGGTLTATQAGFAVEADDKGSRAYCVSGQLTWATDKGGNRLESGMSVRLAPGGDAKEEPEAQWDDWTGGLAEPGPPREPEPAAVGQLAARRYDESGQARTPLLIRRHDVKTVIDRDLAITDVEQVFFNPRSDELQGIYTLRLPRGAMVAGFEVRDESEPSFLWNTELGRYVQRVVPPQNGGQSLAGIALEWAGPDRYRAAVGSLLPGKTKIVHVRYMEWLARRDGRRTFVYPMGGQQAPLLGEFSLEVDTRNANAGPLEAGMGARVEGGKVVLRKSDFRPHADFALDLLDPKEPAKATPAYRVSADDGVGRGYLIAPIALPLPPPPASIDLVLLVDTSAATDPGRLDLARALVDAVLRQLGPKDRVAVLAASTNAKPLGAGDALAPITPKRAEELLEALAHEPAAGGTDLGTSLTQAAAIAGPTGVLVYIGDGQPTVGALTAGELVERLGRVGRLPRIFAVGVGGDAKMDLLGKLAEAGGVTARVEDRPDAAHAAYRVLAAAAQPALRDLRFDLGPTVDVMYPTGPVNLAAGDPLLLVGRLRGDSPKVAKLRGERGGEAFSVEIPLQPQSIADGGDIRRRWAGGRLDDLLARGAGREAIVEVGTRFGLVTPWTALVTSGDAYSPIDPGGFPDGFRPFIDREAPPDDAPIALEAGTTSTPSSRGALEARYAQLLGARDEGVRACYDRKAASHPELSGRVEFAIKIGLGGEIAAVKILSSTLGDPQVEACITRAVSAMRLPPPPDGKIHDLLRAWQFEAEDGRLGAPSRCSGASRQYLATRRALWRERLSQNPGVEGAMAVWRGAERSCELRTWLDRRALLDLLRPHVGRTAMQVDLYHRFEGQSDVQAHLRREILRAVRTPQDVRAVRGGLALDGGIASDLLEAQLKKAEGAAARVRVLRLFLALAPDGIALRVRLLAALEEAARAAGLDGPGKPLIEEARRVAWSLRADPAADLGARQSVGELLARLGDAAESARAFSEIVEFAPFDPWARRRLGDLYLAHARFEDAYREYQTLAWLTPTDNTVLLLLARAAAGAGRLDEALRLEERLTETVEAKGGGNDAAGWARAHVSLQLAAQREAARKSGDAALQARLAARTRADGVLTWAGDLLAGVTWQHPDARIALHVTPPGEKEARPAEVTGGEVGVTALRLKRRAEGDYLLTIQSPTLTAPGADRVRSFDGELLVVFDEAQPTEKLVRLPLHLTFEVPSAAFTVSGKSVSKAAIPVAGR